MRMKQYIIVIFFIGILCICGFTPTSAQNNQLIIIQQFPHMIKSISSPQHQQKTMGQYPPDFQVDDLVFFNSTFRPGRWNVPGLDHIAIYLGNDTFLCTTINKQTHVGEVNIVTYDDLFTSWMLKDPQFARVVNATAEQRHAATEWALGRIGDKYQTWDPRKCADPNSSMITARRWYCSEIVWAAYYNQGIEIDKNGWTRDFPSFFPVISAVSPQDIFDDNDLIHFS
jgi:uncharacterized protein YycO